MNVPTLQSIVRFNTVAVFVHVKRILLERSENYSRFRWPRGLGRDFAASRLQRLRVRFPPVVVYICLLGVLYVVRTVHRADHSSRGVPPSVVFVSVIAIFEYRSKCHRKEKEEKDRNGSILISE